MKIRFRGKRVDNGEFIESSSVLNCPSIGRTYLQEYVPHICSDWVEVDTATVCQFTGLTDKEGVAIYEGDIYSADGMLDSVIIFHDGCFSVEPLVTLAEAIDYYGLGEVTGNIHDKGSK